MQILAQALLTLDFKIANEVDIVTELLHHMRSGNEMAKYDEVVF